MAAPAATAHVPPSSRKRSGLTASLLGAIAQTSTVNRRTREGDVRHETSSLWTSCSFRDWAGTGAESGPTAKQERPSRQSRRPTAATSCPAPLALSDSIPCIRARGIARPRTNDTNRIDTFSILLQPASQLRQPAHPASSAQHARRARRAARVLAAGQQRECQRRAFCVSIPLLDLPFPRLLISLHFNPPRLPYPVHSPRRSRSRSRSRSLTTPQRPQTCTALLALQQRCLHPETQEPYILSARGGVDISPEGLQVRALLPLFLLPPLLFPYPRSSPLAHSPSHLAIS